MKVSFLEDDTVYVNPEGQPPPLCRCCGRPIKKRTVQHWFGRRAYRSAAGGRIVEHTEVATSRAEAARYVNGQIVASKNYPDEIVVTTWDGCSYEDATFCTMRCAADYGRFAIRHPGAHTAAWVNAYNAQLAKLED